MPDSVIATPNAGAPVDRLATVADQIAAFGASASGSEMGYYAFADE